MFNVVNLFNVVNVVNLICTRVAWVDCNAHTSPQAQAGKH